MTEKELRIFIEKMEEAGDVWEFEDAKRVYGKKTLKEALDDRRGDLSAFADIIAKVLNR